MTTSDTVISVENVSKSYLLGHNSLGREQYTALRDVLARNTRTLFRKTRDMLTGRPIVQGDEIEEFWALKDVSFEINRGDRVGVIGKNGAGKSTLLKILSRITEPTRGRIKITGRVASLLEVGTGFHPELSGRENIFLNGSILGMSRREIQKKFDEIVAFAEVEKFLDTPVKRYSSGMYVRLAFAVAAHLEPEVLIVDEVLAVGDAQFQKKCLGKMEEVSSKEGRTVLFVSHNMGAVRGLCSNALWLENGVVKKFGPAGSVVGEYLDMGTGGNDFNSSAISSGDKFCFRKVIVRDSDDRETRIIKPGESFAIELHYTAKERLERPFFWVDVIGPYGHLFGASMIFDNLNPSFIEGDGVIACRFSNVTLLPQTYSITLRARGSNGVDILAPTIAGAAVFQVSGTAEEYGMLGELANQSLDHDTPMIVPYQWIYGDGSTAVPAWQLKNSKTNVINEKRM
jgi:lipopolysaccharide transport system ATP-binding protein